MARIVSELIYKLIADETELVKGLQKAEKSTDALAKKFTDSGKKLTLGLTVPIVAAGAAMVKLASETEDSINAVKVIFKDGADAILDYGKVASETAGLSQSSFNDVANSFGVLLAMTTNDMNVVSANTIELTQRAADLASLLGGSTKEAAVALGAALRGETEPARRYGIILSEATVQSKALELGIGGVKGELTEAEKVQVRYNLILEQSSRAQGDFANTNDDTKNSAQVLRAQIANLTAELGEQLLPITVEVLSSLRGLMSSFSDLTDEQKRAILITAGVAAAIGPMLIGIGQAIQAVNTLKTSFIALSAAGGGPIALAISGIAAVSLGLLAFTNNVKTAQEEYKKLTAVMAGKSKGSLSDDLKLVNREIDIVKAKIGGSTGLFPKEDAELQKELATLKALSTEIQMKIQGQRAVNDGKREEKALTDAQIISAEKLAEIQAKYRDTYKDVIGVLQQEKSEYQLLEEQIIQFQSVQWPAGEYENNRLLAIEALRARQAQLLDSERLQAIQVADEVTAARIAADTVYLENRVMLSDQLIAIGKTNAAEQLAIEEKAKEDFRRIMRERLSIAMGMFNQLTSIFTLTYQNETMMLDKNYNDEVKRINDSTMNEQDKADAIKKLDQDLAIEKAKIARKQAALDKATSMVNVAISTSEAIMKAYASLPFPAAVVASVIVGALGLKMESLIAKQPLPEIPSFAKGGSFIVPEGFNNDSYPLPAAMVSSGERVTVETPEQQASNRQIVINAGMMFATPDNFRQLDSMLRDVGSFETARRG